MRRWGRYTRVSSRPDRTEHSKGHRVETRRPEPEKPRPHRAGHDRRCPVRQPRIDQPEAGTDPVDRVPGPHRRHDLPGSLPGSRRQRRVDADRDRHPGRPRPRVDDRDQHDQRLDRAGVVHLRHRPRHCRAEDHASDQPDLVAAARERRTQRALGEHRRLPRHPDRRHRLRRPTDHPGDARVDSYPRARGCRRGQRRADRRWHRPAHHDHA